MGAGSSTGQTRSASQQRVVTQTMWTPAANLAVSEKQQTPASSRQLAGRWATCLLGFHSTVLTVPHI